MSALWLFQTRTGEGVRGKWRALALAAWRGFLALSLTHPQRHLPDQIEEWRTILANGSNNVRLYVATGDASFLARKPAVEIPAFDAGLLRDLLDTPEIRAALPPDLLSRPAPRTWVETIKSGFLRLSWLWFGVGAGLLAGVVAASALAARRSRKNACPSPAARLDAEPSRSWLRP